MLVIRMQRTGRKGHAMFRVVVQDSRRTPTSGKLVASLGSYDPHTKTIILDKEKASFYVEHGAQPSNRVARLLKAEGVKLPDWVKLEADKERTVRNADKRRSTRPEEPAQEAAPEAAPESSTEDTDPTEAAEAPSEEKPKAAEEAPVTEAEQADGEAESPSEPEAPAEDAPDAEPAEDTAETETSDEASDKK